MLDPENSMNGLPRCEGVDITRFPPGQGTRANQPEQAGFQPAGSDRARETRQSGGNDTRKPIQRTPYCCVDPSTIPRREWLYDRHLIRGYVSTTIAPGGVGKTSLTIVEALAMVTGQPLLGAHVLSPLKVWVYNLEDPRDEIARRVEAARLHYDLSAEDIGDRLSINSGRDVPMVIAEQKRDGTIIHQPVVAEIEREILAGGIDVMIVDPFVKSHGVPENDNGSIDRVVTEWAGIAHRCNCAIELVHHVRKAGPGQQGYTVEDARGGSALIGAVRSARVLNVMSKEEAERFGIEPEHRLRYFRVDNGKLNMAPPSEHAVWRELRSTSLGNGNTISLGNGETIDLSDHVGVVVSWNAPNPTDAVKPEHAERVVAMVKADPDWRADSRASHWIGEAIAEVMGLDLDNKADKECAKKAFKMWLKSGALATEKRDDEHRKEREYVIVGPKWDP